MEIQLRKYGNSTVAVLPPAVLKDLGLGAGQKMTLHAATGGKITLTPKRRHYRLADLLAEHSKVRKRAHEEQAWLDSPAAGRELL